MAKKQRINAGLLQIKATNPNNLQGLENLIEYFALSEQHGEEEIEVIEKPTFCREHTKRTTITCH